MDWIRLLKVSFFNWTQPGELKIQMKEKRRRREGPREEGGRREGVPCAV